MRESGVRVCPRCGFLRHCVISVIQASDLGFYVTQWFGGASWAASSGDAGMTQMTQSPPSASCPLPQVRGRFSGCVTQMTQRLPS